MANNADKLRRRPYFILSCKEIRIASAYDAASYIVVTPNLMSGGE